MVACTVSGSTITVGTNASVDNSGAGLYTSLCRLSDTKFVYAYQDTTNTDTSSRCGTVSGTTITLGTEVELNTQSCFTSVAMIGTDKVLYFYATGANGYARV